MQFVCLALSWLFAILFGLFALSMVLMGNQLQAIPLLGVVLLLLPPVRTLIHRPVLPSQAHSGEYISVGV